MYRIRLMRIGRKKRAFFRIVASDSKSPRLSSGAKKLGYFCPFTNTLSVNSDDVLRLVNDGAKISKNLFWRLKKHIPILDVKNCD